MARETVAKYAKIRRLEAAEMAFSFPTNTPARALDSWFFVLVISESTSGKLWSNDFREFADLFRLFDALRRSLAAAEKGEVSMGVMMLTKDNAFARPFNESAVFDVPLARLVREVERLEVDP